MVKKSFRRFLALVLTLAILVSVFLPSNSVLAAEVQGNSYYVDPVNGSDTNAGTDAAPFKSILFAISQMVSGDTLYLKEGTYSETSPGLSYMDASNISDITIRNYGSDKPVIAKNLTFFNSTGFTISGLEIKDQLGFVNCDTFKVTNNEINGGYCVVVPGDKTNTRGFEVSNNQMHNCSNPPIWLNGVQGGQIFNNVVYNNSSGILVEGMGSLNSFFNNTLYGNGADLNITYNTEKTPEENSHGNVFKNNIFGTRVNIAHNKLLETNTFDYNCYAMATDYIGVVNSYDAETGAFKEELWPGLDYFKGLGQEANGFKGDSLYKNAGANDFNLTKGSPCIGTGTADGAPAADVTGIARVQPYDIGAYKYISVKTGYYVSPDGNDANAGTDAAPFKSILFAISKMQPGDTLYLKGGTYTETSPDSGYMSISDISNITIRNYDSEKPVLAKTIVFYNSRGFTISGLEVQNQLGFVNCDTFKVTKNDFNGGYCVVVPGSGTNIDGFEVSNNLFHDNASGNWTIWFNGVQGGKVFNNVIRNNTSGILLEGTASLNSFYNNTMSGNTLDLLITYDLGKTPEANSHGNVFKNNIFGTRIDISHNKLLETNTFDYNCYAMTDGYIGKVNVYDDTTGAFKEEAWPAIDFYQGLGQETHGFMGDPLYKNAEADDYNLTKGSPCIGTAAADGAPQTDIAGIARELPYDIGAYKYVIAGNDYYVATDGLDTNDGSETAPFKTFEKALSIAQPGDRILVKAGTYGEYVKVTNKTNVTIMNYGMDKPVFTNIFLLTDSQGISVTGLEMQNELGCINSNFKFTKLDFNKGQFVIVPGDGTITTGYEVSNCLFHDTKMEGAALYIHGGRNGRIFNNIIYNNNTGILVTNVQPNNNIFYNNTLYGNTYDLAMSFDPIDTTKRPSGNVFKNNIFSDHITIGDVSLLATNTFDYNCYNSEALSDYLGYVNIYNADGSYNTTLWPTLAQLQSDYGFEPHGFLADPAFANKAVNDFRLKSNSACIGKGTADGAPAVDFKGYTREVPYDIGAYKFVDLVFTYYVSVDGNDNNPGLPEAPFRTIQHAIDAVTPGMTIFVKGGTYDESLTISGKTGTGADGFILRPMPGETVVLDSANQKETAVSMDQGSAFWKIDGINIKNYTGNGVEIKGGSNNISFKNAYISDTGSNAISGDNAANCILEGVKVSGAGNGLALTGSTGWSIYRSSFDKAVQDAAVLNASSARITSSMFTNSKAGMSLIGSTGLIAYNNDFYGNTISDMKVDAASAGNIVKNNIFGSASATYSLDIANTDNDFDYNCYAKAGNAVCNTAAISFAQFMALGKEANGVNGDPTFMDPANGNFLLKPGSLCAKKGLSDGNTPQAGFDGVSFESPVDIGAIFSPFSLNTYYISIDGNDSNDGSFEHPWRTFQKGLNTIKQSDTLYVRGGVYNERVNLYDKVGSEYSYFTVKNYNGEEVILDSQFSQDVGFKLTNCSYWKIDGLKFTNYAGAALWVTGGSSHVIMENLEIWNIDEEEFITSGTEAILGDGGYNTVKNCYIHDIGLTRRSMLDHGIYVGYGAHHWTFDSNRINNCADSGIQFYGQPAGGEDCVVINNIISNCRNGLILDMSKRIFISNNTFYNNWSYDLYMDWWFNDSLIQNNIFYNDLPAGTIVKVEDVANKTVKDKVIDPTPLAFLWPDVTGNTFKNNIMYNKNYGNRISLENGEEIVSLQDFLATHTANTMINMYAADPMFIDSANRDFKLKSNSPCIDAGIPEGAPTVDYTGAQRTSIPDLGAYEYIKAGEEPPVIITPAPSTSPTPTPTTTPADPQFKDVEGNWAYKAIMNMAKAGVLTGYSDGTARPNANATRAEFVTFVTKLMKAEASTTADFSDIDSSAWYMKYLSAAVEKGWIDGRTDGSFGPNDWITREEAMKIISKVIDSLGVQTTVDTSVLDTYKDKDGVSSWARNDAAKLIGLGIIEGSEGRLNPKARITRAEICTILDRIMEKYMNK